MRRAILDWIDERTGARRWLGHVLGEPIAGGARWAYVFGSLLLALFVLQAFSGALLMLAYTPSVRDAWSSVHYIEHRMVLGWFVRGVHHYGAQAMVVVLGLHMAQVVVYGAYRRPREVTFFVGLLLFALVLGLALTGYLLPWDQKGYWATKVATNIAGSVPVVGAPLQRILVGGAEYGQATLTRFFALHVVLLPASVVGLVAAHLALFRRHGVTPPAGADLERSDRFFPGQLARDAVAAALVILGVAALAWRSQGAPLDAPADPTVDYPPRPEWYFLFLFQLLKLVPPELEIVGTVVIPGLAALYFVALPFVDRAPTTRVRERAAVLLPFVLGVVGVCVLTVQSWRHDAGDAKYQRARARADAAASRASELAMSGIPPLGPLEMLRQDPLTHGARVYGEHCSTCHRLDGAGERDAPDHTGFGSREWILALLRDPRAPRFFGNTKHDGMPSQSRLGDAALVAVTEFVFAQGHEAGDPPYDAALAARGRATFESKCMNCHVFEGDGSFLDEPAPNLTGYGSRAWIRRQIDEPSSDLQYGELHDMPAFAEKLEEHDRDMLVAFLRLQRASPSAPTR